jgi:DNA-binding FrmR family transcriptional regulator
MAYKLQEKEKLRLGVRHIRGADRRARAGTRRKKNCGDVLRLIAAARGSTKAQVCRLRAARLKPCPSRIPSYGGDMKKDGSEPPKPSFKPSRLEGHLDGLQSSAEMLRGDGQTVNIWLIWAWARCYSNRLRGAGVAVRARRTPWRELPQKPLIVQRCMGFFASLRMTRLSVCRSRGI